MSLRLAILAAPVAFALAACHADPPSNPRVVPMVWEDGRAYLVESGESLESAVENGTTYQHSQEKGSCVPPDRENKPADSVECRCYEVTECKGTESRQCKRHCRKDLCHCCDI